jgi:para-aminobenzoate synthetase / 4-amino-4-deoxychorismate lyase
MGDLAADCFALLDDRDATFDKPASRLYHGFEREHRCVDPIRLDALWAQVDADLRGGLHAVLLADYEWGAKLLKAGHERLGSHDAGALRVLMFRELSLLSTDEVSEWLAARDAGQPAGVMNLMPSVDNAAFTQAIARIHDAIAAGETYQVNYTYRLHAQAYGSPLALYRKLRERQPVSYGALIALPAGGLSTDATTHVLSCSPELFLHHTDGLLTARPMKGTASRIQGAEGDSETARHLSIDIKNRAENLMIVDLLRNDLGRLAQTGSVKVPELFAIEPYSTVFQMTSTVQARLRPEVGVPVILRATFPCGSITGAPKHHTMQLIAGLESTQRGLYCGAIGWMDAPRGEARCGDFCLSVAIRTLTLAADVHGLRPARLGIGAGIVADSRAADEFDECRLKARFLTGLDPGFALFETLRATRENGAPHLDRHLSRLAHSAAVLGFGFDRAALLESLQQAVQALPPAVVSRLRLELAHDGRITVSSAALLPLPDGPVELLIAPEPLTGGDPLSRHKTTARQNYDAGVRAAERMGAFDSLFFTRTGRLVEGGRSNVFALIGGRWWTPPLRDGALPGVMRAMLLEDAAWGASERTLRLQDLQGARSIIVCNALRGALPARLAAER